MKGIESEILVKTASKDIPSDFPIYWLIHLIDKQLEKRQKITVMSGQLVEEIGCYREFSTFEKETLRRYRAHLVEGALPLVALSSRFPHLACAYKSLFDDSVHIHKLSLPSAYGFLPQPYVPEDFPIEYLLEAVDIQIAELDPAVLKGGNLFTLMECRKMLEEGTLCFYDQGYVAGCKTMESKLLSALYPEESPKFIRQQAEAAWRVQNSKPGDERRVQNSKLGDELPDESAFVKGYCHGYHNILQEKLAQLAQQDDGE
ncbi:MAG: hypothetical protein B0A82_22800 [Alkalinema sp. CACIAM 70d]|nr:MAG: hypothetical protein B0A82_22800 [Alkalinema sp. CACIAM 70d]